MPSLDGVIDDLFSVFRTGVMKPLLVLAILAVTSPCYGQQWRQVKGAMTHVSVGESGVWGVNSRGDIFYREGSYNNADNTDQCAVWRNIPGSLKQIDVGKDFVIGVQNNDNIFYRTGISPSQPTGTNWSQLDGSLKHVTVSSNGSLWGVNYRDEIYFRTGGNQSNPVGSGWQNVPGALKQISAGPSGVWGVNSNNDIWYRVGTYGGASTVGSAWYNVASKLIYVTSGSGVVIGVTAQNRIVRRSGISAASPTGDAWVYVDGVVSMIEQHSKVMWGVNNMTWTSPSI